MVAARFLLFIYLNATLSMLLPVAMDVAAHLFWRQGHLKQVHVNNSNNHVGHEIAKLLAEENGQNTDGLPLAADHNFKTTLSNHLFAVPIFLKKNAAKPAERMSFSQPVFWLAELFFPVFLPPPELLG